LDSLLGATAKGGEKAPDTIGVSCA
jgi:hypothetical protein